MNEIAELLRSALGIGQDPDSLSWLQMSLRAAIIFLFGVALVRLGDKRLRGKNTAFDMLMAIVIGSVLSRAINGNAAFFPTLAAAAVLVALHWGVAALAFHLPGVGFLAKGRERVLVRDGQIQWDQMRKAHVSNNDLEQGLRLQGYASDLEDVMLAYLERSGDISVIRRTGSPRVVEIEVKNGVQTVRLELD